MTVKVVTDSGADIPSEILKELEIETVPYLVHFKGETRRDGIDIKAEEIYQRLQKGENLTTSAPSPQEFINTYLRCGANEIISIQLTAKHSATYESALNAKAIVEEEMAKEGKNCRIEPVNSLAILMGVGFQAILAAKAAKEGKGLEEIVKMVNDAIPKIHLIGVLDTLEYALKGGRLGKAAVLIERVSEKLKVKPILLLKDGEIKQGGIVRASKREERLLGFIKSFPRIREVAVEYATAENRGEAEDLSKTIKRLFPGVSLYLSQISSVIGVHSGPGALVVAVREE